MGIGHFTNNEGDRPQKIEGACEMARMFRRFGFDAEEMTDSTVQTKTLLSGKLRQMADSCNKGDIFVFWIDTHGNSVANQYGTRQSWISMSSGAPYSAVDMAKNMMAFANNGVAVVPIVSACHSEGMTDASDHVLTATDIVDSGFAQCSYNVDGIAACSKEVNLPAVTEGSGKFSMFLRAFLDSEEMVSDSNKDGVISLGEMASYVRMQQNLFTPTATMKILHGGLINKLVMKEATAIPIGERPDAPTDIKIKADGNYDWEMSWDSSNRAEWYSIQCEDVGFSCITYKKGFLINVENSFVTFNAGQEYEFVVYAGNKYGRSEGVGKKFTPPRPVLRFVATTTRADGVSLVWRASGTEPERFELYRNKNNWLSIGEGDLIANVDGTTSSYFDDASTAGEDYRYTLKMFYANETNYIEADANGLRVAEYKLVVCPEQITIGPEEQEIQIDVKKWNALWSFFKDADFCHARIDNNVVFLLDENTDCYPREAKIIFYIEGTDVSKTVTITQLGAGDKRCEEKALSAFMSRKRLKSEARLSEDADGNGLPDLFDYAYQDNEEAAKESLCKIEMENGLPKISVPKQNPFTTREVDVYVESSEDMVNWSRVEDASEPCNSADGNRVEHSPKVKENSSRTFFRARADFR